MRLGKTTEHDASSSIAHMVMVHMSARVKERIGASIGGVLTMRLVDLRVEDVGLVSSVGGDDRVSLGISSGILGACYGLSVFVY